MPPGLGCNDFIRKKRHQEAKDLATCELLVGRCLSSIYLSTHTAFCRGNGFVVLIPKFVSMKKSCLGLGI